MIIISQDPRSLNPVARDRLTHKRKTPPGRGLVGRAGLDLFGGQLLPDLAELSQDAGTLLDQAAAPGVAPVVPDINLVRQDVAEPVDRAVLQVEELPLAGGASLGQVSQEGGQSAVIIASAR